MFFKKLISFIVCLALIASILPFSVFSGYLPLNDVPINHWARKAVEYMYNSGIMKGTTDTDFGGRITMTRAMFVTMIAALSKAELGSSSVSHFSDVGKDKYYTAAANWAYENGLVAGNENGQFMPNAPLTREQTYVMLRALGEFLNYDVTYEDPTILSLYHDASFASSYAKSALAWACNYGLASGGDDYTIMPKKTATRYEIAAIVYRFLNYQNIPPIEIPVIHTVTFKNWDGTTLYSSLVKEGDTAVYRASTPTRSDGADYTYTFSGWNKSLTNVTSDTVYTAVFKAVPIPKYLVTFKNWNGTVLYTTYVKYGQDAYYQGQAPTRASDSSFNYVFSGWDKSAANITCDTVITAVFVPSPINYVRNIYDDVFGYGITINGSDFRMSQSLSNRLNSALTNSGGRTVGFYVVDLTNNVTLGYNAQKKFQTASTVKAGMALCAYQRAEAGWFSLNDIWTYKQRHYCDRSGNIQFSPFGTRYKAVDVIHEMIYVSDNAAYYMTQDYVGYDAYNQTMANLGVSNRHWSHMSWGSLSPQELGFIWKELFSYRYRSAYGSQLFDEFLNAKFNFIKQSLYSKYPVAHKSGFNDHGYHDSAIVFAERPYIMVIMTSPGNKDDRQQYLAKIARLLDEYMQEYTAYLKNTGKFS